MTKQTFLHDRHVELGAKMVCPSAAVMSGEKPDFIGK